MALRNTHSARMLPRKRQGLCKGFGGIRMVFGSKLTMYCVLFSWLAFLFVAAQPSPSQTPPPTVRSIAQAIRAGHYAKALGLARVLARQEPGDSRAWILEGVALSELGEAQEGLKAFRRALEVSPQSVPALEGAAQLEYNSGEWQDAAAHLDELIRLDPQEETAHAILGAMSFKRKDCTSAVAQFNQSWEAIENNLIALAEYGMCLAQSNRPGSAIRVFERMTELKPDDWYYRYDLALVQHRVNQNAAAIKTLEPLVEGSAPDADCLSLIAGAYEASHQTPLAVAALQRAIALQPRNPENYVDLASISLDTSSFQVGIDVLNSGLREIPNSAALHIQRGVLYVETGRFEEANADFQKANELNGQQTKGTAALALSLLQAGKTEQSLKVVRTRLVRTPNSPSLNYLLAEILFRKGVRPGTRDFTVAVAAAERSTRVNPRFGLAYDLLSELDLRAGETNEAVAESRAALRLDPRDESAAYLLVEALRKTGNQAELASAVKQLARITAAVQRENSERNHFRLVELSMNPGRNTPPMVTPR
jgi:tetratricopeptide (TPR) repeat protein